MKTSGKHRGVEIYFILYLAALMLLLPNSKNEKTGEELVEKDAPFTVLTDKNSLNCRIVKDSLGYRVVSIDTTNRIFIKGNPENVKLDFIIEEKYSDRSLVLSPDSLEQTKLFSIEWNNEEKSALFHWRPKLYPPENKSYIVKIDASGTYKENGQLLSYIGKAQFAVNMTVFEKMDIAQGIRINNTSEITIIDSLAMLIGDRQTLNYGELIIDPQVKILEVYPFEKWRNRINVFNVNPRTGLSSIPGIIVNGSVRNDIRVADYLENGIIIEGSAPLDGSEKVSISIERANDSEIATTDFIVKTVPIEKPDFEKVMYPEKSYRINPNLPLRSRNQEARLVEGDKIRMLSNQGEIITFTPAISDTGKTFFIERFIDDILIGQKYVFKVANYPEPRIRNYEIRGDTLELRTISQGYIYGKNNFVKKIEIIDGSVSYRELYGDQYIDSDKGIYYQTFYIYPKKNSKLKMRIRLVDERGFKSEDFVYP